MDPSEIQKKIFAVIAVFMLLSVVSLIAVIPAILQDTSPGAVPIRAASGSLIGMGIHLFLAYLFGLRLRKSRSVVRKEIHIFSALGFFFLDFMIMDGAFAFLEELRFVSIGMFTCAFFDFAAALVSVFALILVKSKKKD